MCGIVVDIKLLLTLWIGQSDTQRQSRQVSRSTEKTLLKNAKNFTTDEALTTPTLMLIFLIFSRAITKGEDTANVDGNNKSRNLILWDEAPHPRLGQK